MSLHAGYWARSHEPMNDDFGRPAGSLRPNFCQTTVGSLGGNTFYVNSAVDSPDGRSPQTAFGTLDEAFAKCTANRGDVIVVMPGHSETVTGAGGISHDVAGVSVIGLGVGSDRPTFLMDASTAVTYAITADNAYVENLLFKSGHSNVVACITTTKKGTWINNCEFQNNTTNEDFLTCIKASSTTNNDSDGLRVTNCRWTTSDSDDLEFIEINANLDGFVCGRNFVSTAGTASPLILVASGKILTGARIGWNAISNRMTANELFISNDGTTNNGVLANNYVGHADVTGTHDPGWDAGGFRLFNNWSTSVDTLQGVMIPAADVNL